MLLITSGKALKVVLAQELNENNRFQALLFSRKFQKITARGDLNGLLGVNKPATRWNITQARPQKRWKCPRKNGETYSKLSVEKFFGCLANRQDVSAVELEYWKNIWLEGESMTNFPLLKIILIWCATGAWKTVERIGINLQLSIPRLPLPFQPLYI